ncbi:hypothetical protein V8C42DRAFT_304639, partial [Trichoderma barbatum]
MPVRLAATSGVGFLLLQVGVVWTETPPAIHQCYGAASVLRRFCSRNCDDRASNLILPAACMMGMVPEAAAQGV